jgi:hypothetical protein
MLYKKESYQGMPSDMPLAHVDARKSFRKGFTLAAAVALSVAMPFLAGGQKAAPANPTAELPAGAMQAKATASCLECHEARIILQQRLSKAAWTKEVDKMTKWGALVDAADRDALIDYLNVNFSLDTPAYEPQRTTANTRDSGKAPK